jgi:multidrug efflux pump subunit AcrB
LARWWFEFELRRLCKGDPSANNRARPSPMATRRQRLGGRESRLRQAGRAFSGFLQGVKYTPVWDPTVFVRHSIKAVQETLIEAVVLVVLVVILFLQTWRASVIPLIAVPVSVVGTFAWLYVLGYSINTLTLFGLVLAIGIVVDDAIVVVENVERNIARGG